MTPTYEIVSIEPAEPPPNADGANWYQYVIASDDTNTVHGCRQGSLKTVTSAVEEIVAQLNERHAKKRKKVKTS